VPDDETLFHPEQPRFLLSAWLWAVVLFVFFGAIVAIDFGAMHRGSTFEEDRGKTRAEKLKGAQEEASKTLASYGWVDKGKGVAHIPITRAMELALADLQSKKPAPAGPVATPEPAVPVTETGAGQPANPPNAAPAAQAATPAPSSVEGLNSEIRGQPTGAANPPSAQPGTQPGASATPAAGPNSQTQVPPASPTATPIQQPPGTPIPVRGATPGPGKP
jgi:ribonuclease E